MVRSKQRRANVQRFSIVEVFAAYFLFAILLAQPAAFIYAAEEDATSTPETAAEVSFDDDSSNDTDEPELNDESDEKKDDTITPEVDAEVSDESDNENTGQSTQTTEERATNTQDSNTAADTATGTTHATPDDTIASGTDATTTPPDNPKATSTDGTVASAASSSTSTATSTQQSPTTTDNSVGAGDEASSTRSTSTEQQATTTDTSADVDEESESEDKQDVSPDPMNSIESQDSASNDDTNNTDDGTATTSEQADDVVEYSEQATVVYNNQNKFQFSSEQCVNIGDGSFYCTEADTRAASLGTDRVFAAADSDGDREIYIEYDDEHTKITDNTTDDAAPFYDELSESIVWQRQVDGRYQIISFDLDTQTETQLTDGRENSMQPSRYGDVTVWQTWNNNGWDIVLHTDGERQLLTDNDVHDISPRINGNYVVWQSFENAAWVVKVYDRSTGRTDTIEESSGSSVENPRFVLVYDTKDENGDIETKGYDLDSKDVVPLSSTPAPVPTNIPDPEQTGEDRAIVSSPVQVKSKSSTSTNDTTNTGHDDTELDLTAPTSTEAHDVIVTPYVEESAATSSDDTTATSSAEGDFDLVIPSAEAAENASTTDSQGTVATTT